MSLRVLVQECTDEDVADKKLPVHSYVVSYVKEDKVCRDIVLAGSKGTVEIFDHYWDLYKEGLQGWKQTNGRVPVNRWNNQRKAEEKPKPKRKK